MTNSEWLGGLSVGDEVVVWRWAGPGDTRYRLAKVERFTKTRIIADGRHFNRNTGREIGAAYHAAHLKNPADCEKGLAESRRRDLLNKIRMKDIEQLGDEKLRQIIDVIESGSDEAVQNQPGA